MENRNKTKNIIKQKKGFTLVELVVVLVILAVLISIAVPTFFGYQDKARREQYKTECRELVAAAQLIARKAKPADGNELVNEFGQAIILSAGVEGKISLIVMEKESSSMRIKELEYVPKDTDILVRYIAGNLPYEVFIDDDMYLASNAPGYASMTGANKISDEELKKLIEPKDQTKNNITKVLQNNFREKYDGNFPKVTEDEIKMVSHVPNLSNILQNAYWKPMITINGERIMVVDAKDNASTVVGNTMAAMLYYNGKYYCPRHRYTGNADRRSVSDTDFDLGDLSQDKEPLQWIEIKIK